MVGVGGANRITTEAVGVGGGMDAETFAEFAALVFG